MVYRLGLKPEAEPRVQVRSQAGAWERGVGKLALECCRNGVRCFRNLALSS